MCSAEEGWDRYVPVVAHGVDIDGGAAPPLAPGVEDILDGVGALKAVGARAGGGGMALGGKISSGHAGGLSHASRYRVVDGQGPGVVRDGGAVAQGRLG